MEKISSIQEFKDLLLKSQKETILFCKFSPICPTSFMAQREVESFLKDESLKCYSVDVVKQRALSREIADLTGIRHESPQAFLLKGQKVTWSGSHYHVNRDSIKKAL